MTQSSPNHHSGGLQRIPRILASPVDPRHTSRRVFWFFVVDTIQIRVMTILKPPSIPVWSCTVTTPFVVITVLCGKLHPVLIRKWIICWKNYFVVNLINIYSHFQGPKCVLVAHVHEIYTIKFFDVCFLDVTSLESRTSNIKITWTLIRIIFKGKSPKKPTLNIGWKDKYEYYVEGKSANQ